MKRKSKRFDYRTIRGMESIEPFMVTISTSLSTIIRRSSPYTQNNRCVMSYVDNNMYVHFYNAHDYSTKPEVGQALLELARRGLRARHWVQHCLADEAFVAYVFFHVFPHLH